MGPLYKEPVMSDDVEVFEKTTPYKGYFRIDQYRLRHRTHDGGWTEEMSREVFERGHAVAVLLYDPERDAVGLIEQFRPGALAGGWHPWLIEIVAGVIDHDDPPEKVARREVKEEAGVEVSELLQIGHYLVSPGGTTESVHLYIGRVDSTQLSGIHGLAHEGEDIRVFSAPADEAIGWITSGKVNNSMTIIALQWLALNRASLLAQWTA